uniref:V-type proton ATPase 116 kDa subunit a-like isoform X1 n=1 Tax=Ciona intestinalis TaxID=7719 RepID=UPI000EF4DF06|nr:V-type proton ATPase 116 kDa subunit a-like isoform X1 [Ciona intestinalis]|eukprot:XP_026689897.1 V-type proton ATPase 116 kDa subunit a-like isoform X1 [Ciona intestinalis]
MGSLFRSEEMCLAQLYLQSEAAFACVSELGELGLAQFRDLNPNVNAFQRKFVNEVRRCDEMERKLRFLERELKKDKIPIRDTGDDPVAPPPREMIGLEAKFEKLENEMKEVNTNQEALKRNFLELTELKHILRKTQSFFEEAAMYHGNQPSETNQPEEENLLVNDYTKTPYTKLGFVAGVILREKVPAFERVLWRACRGNVFLRHAEIETTFEDPHTGDTVNKCVFIIFFQGDQLKTRVKKICEGFHASVYPCPESPQERKSTLDVVSVRIEDMQAVLNQTEDHRKIVLSQVALDIRVWFIKVRKIKAIYHTLNLFNVNIAEKCLIAECWCPVVEIDRIQLALRKGTELSGSSVPSIMQRMNTKEAPPTYNRTDKFTQGFQAIIDAFGIANYREVNPAPFTIITFPFLFAVMFGDIGHGLLMFLFALYLVLSEKKYLAKKPENEIFEMMFDGRYLILLMGIFSMYTGFLYNECFSRSINVFGSAWNVNAMNDSNTTLQGSGTLTLDPKTYGVFRGTPLPYPNGTGDPYPYGIDPIWQSAGNKISVQNSYKMKNAVIMGLLQMIFGLVLAFYNHRYNKDYLALFCEWIPQLIFLMCLIGYLCILIFYKWAVWNVLNSNSAPSLLIGLINMFMFTKPTWAKKTQLYSNQNEVQITIVIIAILCVPWMLLTKPIILYLRNKAKMKQLVLHVDPIYNHDSTANMGTTRYAGVRVAVDETSDDVAILDHDHLDDPETASITPKDEEEKFDMSEVLIYQVIHTIEYCLSCISHTASYLRLWALSLAHSELSEVLWTMVMHSGLSAKGILGAFMSFVIFWGFAGLTVGILLVMEGLSAFLHALRLHWVEFQSKFYKGEGYLFTPFSFSLIVEGRVDE